MEFKVYLTPGNGHSFKMVDWRQELPLGDQERTVATRLVTTMNQAALRARGLFAEKADRAELLRRLVVERAARGTCTVSRPLYNDGKGNSFFELRCGASLRQLSFRLAAESSLVELVVTAPRAYGAMCFE